MTARYSRGILAVTCLCTAASLLRAQTATPLQITTDSLPSASVGAAYNQQLVTTGGVCTAAGTPSSTLDGGALPPGIFVTSPPSTEQWYLQGTPSAVGNFTFTVRLRWTHTRDTPFQPNACVEEAVKTFTLIVQGSGTGGGGTGGGGSTATLIADRPQITVNYRIPHFPPASDTVHLSASGGAAVAFTVQSATDSGSPWLSVTSQGTTTPAALNLAYLVSGMAQGTYTGHIIVTTGSVAALTIPVTLLVTVDTSVQLQPAPSSLAFSAVFGSADPPSQPLKISVAGDNVLFQAAISSATPNGKWLSVAPSAAATPATLVIAVTAKDLAVGVYNGVLTLSVAAVPGASQNIPVTFTILAPAQKPVISAVMNAAGNGKSVAPGTWVSLFGTLLSSTTRAWRDADFVNGRLPTSLDGVSVNINGNPAAVAFISPQQINVLAPDDTATGLVPVLVKNSLGASDGMLALQQTAAPALFQIPNTKYAVGEHADGSYLAGPALVQQGIPGTAARVGETIVLFGTGFGATSPGISATGLVPAPLSLAHPENLHIRIGPVDTIITYAGLISPGLYQFNVVVPQLGDGDQSVVAELRGLLTQSDLLLTIQH